MKPKRMVKIPDIDTSRRAEIVIQFKRILDSYHSVMAKSENSGRIFERRGFAGRTERGDKFMCTVRLKLINFINAKSKLQQETSKPI